MRSQRASSKLAAAGLKDEAAAVEQPVVAANGDHGASGSDLAVRMSAIQSEVDKLKARHRCSVPLILRELLLLSCLGFAQHAALRDSLQPYWAV